MTTVPALDLAREMEALCDLGGRLAGSESEIAARSWLRRRGETILGIAGIARPFRYQGWRARRATLEWDGELLPCHPLVRSAATAPDGLVAGIVDVGRGTAEDFERHADEIAGKIVLVRHEVMFSSGTVHRREKIAMSIAAGAVGFIVAGREPGELVTGSSRAGDAPGLPAIGISPETAASLIVAKNSAKTARLIIETEEADAVSENLIFELPGETDGVVVLSAHLDGHDLGESALDNASGMVVALETAARIARRGPRRLGLRLIFFSVEEWGLQGSKAYVTGLDENEKRRIALNLNLDTVAGSDRLTALISGFEGVEPLLAKAALSAGTDIGIFRPLQRNSDHANFADAGIPAIRLVAGFDEPEARTRFVLSGRDRRDLVRTEELERAACLASAIVETALDATPDAAKGWRRADQAFGGKN